MLILSSFSSLIYIVFLKVIFAIYLFCVDAEDVLTTHKNIHEHGVSF